MVEFAEHGQVIELEHHHTVERLWKYTIQAATALEHLDKKKVIHRSVLAFNWFVVADYQVSSVWELFRRFTMLFTAGKQQLDNTIGQQQQQ